MRRAAIVLFTCFAIVDGLWVFVQLLSAGVYGIFAGTPAEIDHALAHRIGNTLCGVIVLVGVVAWFIASPPPTIDGEHDEL